MKAAVLYGPKDLRVDEVDKPTIKHGEVLVKIKACGICTLEQRLFLGNQKIFYPIIAGHEASGIVEEVDENVLTNLKPKDRVALDLLNRCGECYFCRIGSDHLCENRFKPNLNIMGGFGEYVAIPSYQVFKISDSLSYEEAALAEPVATCIHSLRAACISPEETILIIGAGTMGIIHLLLAKLLGIQTIVCDIDKKRLQYAKDLGADFVINPNEDSTVENVKKFTEGRGADVVILATPARNAFEMSLSTVRVGGRILLFSKGDKPYEVSIIPDELHSKEISLIGVQGRTKKDFQEAVALLNRGKLNLKPLISTVVPLEKINEGMELAMSHSTYRVIIRMND